MKIEHVALYVCDLERARDFFIRYFDGKTDDGYHNMHTGFRSYFIRFDGGARLEIMTKPDMDEQDKTHCRTGYVHLAFSVGSKGKVDTITERLRDEYYESCITDLEGNQIEITV